MIQESEVHVRAGGLTLAGTMSRPERDVPLGTAILVPGSGHHDRDETVSRQKPFRIVANHLAHERISALRLDSRGIGASEGSSNEANFHTKVSDLLDAFDYLATEQKVPAERVALIGHSEGGLVAAAASSYLKVPVVMLAAPAVPMSELLHLQAENLSKQAGASKEQLAHERLMNEHVFKTLLGSGQHEELSDRIRAIIKDALASWPDLPLSDHEISGMAEEMTAIVIAPDFVSLLRQDPGAILAAVRAPLLALFAELDQQVIAETNSQAFQRIHGQNSYARSLILPKHNHLFQVASSGHIDEYAALGQSPSPQTLTVLTSWLRDQFGGGGDVATDRSARLSST